MRKYKGIFEIKERVGPVALTVGNFDGLHLGHQKILDDLTSVAKQNGLDTCVLTFDPHPSKILRPQNEVHRLFSLTDLEAQLGLRNISHFIIQPFTRELALLEPREFLEQMIYAKLNVHSMIVGYDFMFGHNRKGNFQLLESEALSKGFNVRQIEPVVLNGEIVSSSLIRQKIGRGEVAGARELLGRPFYLDGKIVRGEARGERIGFPTANLDTMAETLPLDGVYVTNFIIDGDRKPSVTNIGRKPTFHSQYRLSVETFVLNSHENYYDSFVQVEFLERIRPEIKFSGLDELKHQIAQDVDVTKKYFGM